MENDASHDGLSEGRPRWGDPGAWFRPTSTELVGLVALLAGSLLASAMLWWSATTRPDTLPPATAAGSADAGAAGPVAVTPQRQADGSAVALEAPASGEPSAGASDGREQADHLTVHLTGAVSHPGLVTLPPGARVGDAVALAGGLAPEAAVAHVNLARRLSDGEHVHVPLQRDVGTLRPSGAPGPSSDPATAPLPPVDLNRASEAELERLPGIGPARARAIVAHREEHGPFEVPGELREVPGIGERTFQSLAPLVAVP